MTSIFSDTLRTEGAEVLGSARRLAKRGCPALSSGHLSPSVSRGRPVGSPVPQGTVYSFLLNVQGRIVIAIQCHATAITDVRPHAQALLDECAAGTTVLAGVLWCYGYDRDVMEGTIILDPGQERTPSGILDGLGKMMVLDHVAYLKLFVGNQIVR